MFIKQKELERLFAEHMAANFNLLLRSVGVEFKPRLKNLISKDGMWGSSIIYGNEEDSCYEEFITIPHLQEQIDLAVEDYKKRDDQIHKRISDLESIVEKLCPCEHVECESTIEPRFYSVFSQRDTQVYYKVCKVCGRREEIGEKEFLEINKEIIESKLKEKESESE
jgi:hypothetical protein